MVIRYAHDLKLIMRKLCFLHYYTHDHATVSNTAYMLRRIREIKSIDELPPHDFKELRELLRETFAFPLEKL